MNNVNDYQFANILKIVQSKMIEPQRKKVEDAQKIFDDPKYPWRMMNTKEQERNS